MSIKPLNTKIEPHFVILNKRYKGTNSNREWRYLVSFSCSHEISQTSHSIFMSNHQLRRSWVHINPNWPGNLHKKSADVYRHIWISVSQKQQKAVCLTIMKQWNSYSLVLLNGLHVSPYVTTFLPHYQLILLVTLHMTLAVAYSFRHASIHHVLE